MIPGKRLASRFNFSLENKLSLDDDIVHPFWKLKDRCKELVPGSSPGRGAG